VGGGEEESGRGWEQVWVLRLGCGFSSDHAIKGDVVVEYATFLPCSLPHFASRRCEVRASFDRNNPIRPHVTRNKAPRPAFV
jgi:hypothetical protein